MFDTTLFSTRLKEARIHNQMTQAELAEKAGTTATTIAAYEGTQPGIKKHSMELVVKLSEILSVDVNWMCGNLLNLRQNYYVSYNSIRSDNHFSQFSTTDYFTSYARILVDLNSSIELSNDTTVKLNIESPVLTGFIKRVNGLVSVYHDGAINSDVFNKAVDDLIDKYASENIYAFDTLLSRKDHTALCDQYVSKLMNDPKKKSSYKEGKIENPTLLLNESEKQVRVFISDALLQQSLEETNQ